jgi:hypothetical protein
MNFWNLNENEKLEHTVHSVGLEFGPGPGTVGPTQRLFQPGQPGHSGGGLPARQGRVDGGSPKRRVNGEGAVAAVGGGVLRWRGSSDGQRWRWKVLAASEGQGEDEGQSQLVGKGLEEVLTEDGGQRRHQLRCSGGSIGLRGGPAAPREEDDGEGQLKSQGAWVKVSLTGERKAVACR